MSRYSQLREEAWQANMEIPAKGLAIYTFGNVSAFDPEEQVFAIKPSGVPYDQLKRQDMVIVDLDNRVVDGDLRPSSDTKTHAFLYRHFEGIRGITHTHSTYAVAWSQAMQEIPIFGTTHADHLPVSVPVTAVISDGQIENDYEEETGRQITTAFEGRRPLEVPMVLVACHGPFTWGTSAAKSVYHSVVLEELARQALFTRQINPETPLLKETIINKHYQRKHGENAYYGQNTTK